MYPQTASTVSSDGWRSVRNLPRNARMIHLFCLPNVLSSLQKIDFNLTGMGEFVELPGLMTAIRSVMNSQVREDCRDRENGESLKVGAMCVIPNEIVVPLAPDVDVTQLFFPEPNVSPCIPRSILILVSAGSHQTANHRSEESRE